MPSYTPSMASYSFPGAMGLCPVEDSRLSYLRDLCDTYFDPRECAPGAGITRFYSDGIEHANYLAELTLKFYNEKEQKNFYLEKVGKINRFVVVCGLTFWARTAESDESQLFRGVVDLLDGKKVLLCEIKGGNEITIPDNHSENCRLSCSRIYDFGAKNSVSGSISLGCLDLSDMDALDGNCPIAHSMSWALRDLCDTHFDRCDCDPGAGITHIDVDGQEKLNCLASLALKFYNDTEKECFCFKEVVELNIFIAYYCLTFWAWTAEGDACHLFRGVVHVMGAMTVVLCEIKDDDEISIPVDVLEKYRLKRSRMFGTAVRHCCADLGKVDGVFRMDDSVLSSLRELCDKRFDSRDRDPAAGVTLFRFDGLKYVIELAESALRFYNEQEQKNLYVKKVVQLNLLVTYYCLAFLAGSTESDESHLFRGVVDVLGGVNVVLCEFKDEDDITSPVDNSGNSRLKRPRIDDYDASETAGGSVDGSFGAAVCRGGVNPFKVNGLFPVDDSEFSYLRNMCDTYFNPRECHPGGGTTRFYCDGIENANYLAELALKFYNEKEKKNFYLKKVGKLNRFVVLSCLTFWACAPDCHESCLFRGVVDLLNGKKVLLCEIKGCKKITIPDDHAENCLLSCSR
ncbi:uncharacterized protein [Henckelia pumila]